MSTVSVGNSGKKTTFLVGLQTFSETARSLKLRQSFTLPCYSAIWGNVSPAVTRQIGREDLQELLNVPSENSFGHDVSAHHHQYSIRHSLALILPVEGSAISTSK
jgi:hypothetical protein